MTALPWEPAAGSVTVETVHVDGIPVSARVLAVTRPRAVLVALHGGAVNSAYYDSRRPSRSSLLLAGAALGYTVIALDRPGYGASAAYGEHLSAPDARVDLTYGAIDALLASRSRGAGIFVLAHSMGCVLAVRLAADPRGAELLGLEIAATGLVPHPDAAFMDSLISTGEPGPRYADRPRRAMLQEALWNPARLYPPGAAADLGIAASPGYEGPEIGGWIGALPKLAASVRVPVHYTLGDHERVWSTGPAAMAEVGALFTASPRVVTAEQADAAHNLSLGWSALSYHLKVLSFAEECAVARENAGE